MLQFVASLTHDSRVVNYATGVINYAPITFIILAFLMMIVMPIIILDHHIFIVQVKFVNGLKCSLSLMMVLNYLECWSLESISCQPEIPCHGKHSLLFKSICE